MIAPEELMQLALDKAFEGVEAGESPYGCAIALEDRVIAVAHNTVSSATDITAHAEINALRQACAAEDSVKLTGAVVAATCEPCPMCMAALHWADVDTVYFASTIEDAMAVGMGQLTIPAKELVAQGGSDVTVVDGMLREEGNKLLASWKAKQ